MKILNIFFKLSVILLACTYLLKEVVVPEFVYQTNKDVYMKLTLQCAFAMDSNWYIEQQKDKNLKKSSDIQLLDCHDYDKLRKYMLSSGISEYSLSGLGLIALEINQKPAEQLANQHKFRDR
jgi:His-Xaa-Ser system protein (TIGR03982 family)